MIKWPLLVFSGLLLPESKKALQLLPPVLKYSSLYSSSATHLLAVQWYTHHMKSPSTYWNQSCSKDHHYSQRTTTHNLSILLNQHTPYTGTVSQELQKTSKHAVMLEERTTLRWAFFYFTFILAHRKTFNSPKFTLIYVRRCTHEYLQLNLERILFQPRTPLNQCSVIFLWQRDGNPYLLNVKHP